MFPSSTSSSETSLFRLHRRDLGRGLADLARWGLVALAVLAAVDTWYGGASILEFDHRHGQFQERRESVRTLVLGSSRMYRAVLPESLGDDVFSLAANSCDLYHACRILEENLDSMPCLETVVWGMDTFAFTFDMSSSRGEKIMVKVFAPHFGRRWPVRDLKDLYVLLTTHSNILRLWGDRPALQTFLMRASPTVRARHLKPYTPSERSDDHPSVNTGKARAAYHDSDCFQPDLAQVHYRRVLAVCSRLLERGVRIVFVTPPVSSSYRRGVGAERLRIFHRYRERLLEATGAEWVDLWDDFDEGHGYFLDSDHLQGPGARRFTRILGQVLGEARGEARGEVCGEARGEVLGGQAREGS